jgi:glutathione synthase/RimK-type ligase-like ATP-grasp enzyme
MKVFIKPYKKGCSGAKELRKALNNAGVPTKGIRPVGSRYANQDDHLVVNWGDSKCPEYDNMLNNPANVCLATDKYACMHRFDRHVVSIPTSFYTKGGAKDYLELNAEGIIYCRTILNGSKGAGIVIANSVDELVDAQLYTVGITGKRREYRVHVFNGKVIHQQQKKRRDGWKDNPNYSDTVRNLNGGWVFAIKDVEVSEAVKVESIKAVQALGLDFGGVDIVEDANGGVYVIEVNTACGLHGTTIDKYCEAIKAYVEGL